MKAPRQQYNHRGPNCNPRTGEPLVPWQDVQVTPVTSPLATYFVRVQIVNTDGPRYQLIRVRAPAGLDHTEELATAGKDAARLLGFVPTGLAVHD